MASVLARVGGVIVSISRLSTQEHSGHWYYAQQMTSQQLPRIKALSSACHHHKRQVLADACVGC